MSSQSRGVSHLEEVLPLNALQEAMENFIYQCHVSLVHPTLLVFLMEFIFPNSTHTALLNTLASESET